MSIKEGDDSSFQNFHIFGEVEIKGKDMMIKSITTDGTLSPVGGINIKVSNLEKYNNFKFDLEIEEGNAGGMLEINFLEKESSPPFVTYFSRLWTII